MWSNFCCQRVTCLYLQINCVYIVPNFFLLDQPYSHLRWVVLAADCKESGFGGAFHLWFCRECLSQHIIDSSHADLLPTHSSKELLFTVFHACCCEYQNCRISGFIYSRGSQMLQESLGPCNGLKGREKRAVPILPQLQWCQGKTAL